MDKIIVFSVTTASIMFYNGSAFIGSTTVSSGETQLSALDRLPAGSYIIELNAGGERVLKDIILKK